MIYPISFSIPTCKILDSVPEKSKEFSFVDPRNTQTYIYSNEKDYYNDYQQSTYGYTCCKGGWDCLRHYEILANGCIPWFQNLNSCPINTMTHFPKELVLKAMKEKSGMYAQELLDYTRDNLSSKAMAKYVLKKIDKPDISSVLFLSHQMSPDYQRCLTLIGFKELLGSACHDFPCVEHIYKDMSPEVAQKLYGKGFTYSRIFNKSEYRNNNDSTIEEDIKNHKYDLVIYGKVHAHLPHWDLVNKYYSPDEIVLMCGEDIHDCDKKHFGDKYHLFIREL
jgi:hypothetical protein